MSLIDEIKEYYEKRQLKKPDVWKALGWVHAELGEVYEVLMSLEGGWVRNNPENHPQKTKEDLAEELGDVIFMLIVAGISEGLDPIQAIKDKMHKKLRQLESEKVVKGTSQLSILTNEEFSELVAK